MEVVPVQALLQQRPGILNGGAGGGDAVDAGGRRHQISGQRRHGFVHLPLIVAKQRHHLMMFLFRLRRPCHIKGDLHILPGFRPNPCDQIAQVLIKHRLGVAATVLAAVLDIDPVPLAAADGLGDTGLFPDIPLFPVPGIVILYRHLVDAGAFAELLYGDPQADADFGNIPQVFP